MNKFYSLIGLCRRANKLVSGESLVLEAVRSKKAVLVILSTDASLNSEKKITDKCSSYQVPCMRFGLRRELGRAIGKEERVVLAILDQGFAQSLLKSVR